MKLDLEKPYSDLFKAGYIVTNPENRKNVILVREDNSKTTTSYARYLMGVKLGYIVPDEFEVDHKDDDKTNDDPSNLQLLTQEENKKKENYRYLTEETEFVSVSCTYCDYPFSITQRDFNKKINNKTGIFCSKKCTGTYGAAVQNGKEKKERTDVDVEYFVLSKDLYEKRESGETG